MSRSKRKGDRGKGPPPGYDPNFSPQDSLDPRYSPRTSSLPRSLPRPHQPPARAGLPLGIKLGFAAMALLLLALAGQTAAGKRAMKGLVRAVETNLRK